MNVEILYEENYVRLTELASRAFAKGYDGKTAMLVCIEVDSTWRPLVDMLMPDEERVVRYTRLAWLRRRALPRPDTCAASAEVP
jgi:hypothetical protein